MTDERGPDDLVELVARAYHEYIWELERSPTPDFDTLLPVTKETPRAIARAVIAALEPHIQQRERAARIDSLEAALAYLYVFGNRHSWQHAYDSVKTFRESLDVTDTGKDKT